MITVLITFLVTRHYYLKQVEFVTSKVVSAQRLAENNQNTNDDLEIKMQSLELELQERKNKLIDINEKLEQSERSLKSCTGGQAKLEGDAATCNQQMLEKRHQLESKQKDVDRLESELFEKQRQMDGEVAKLGEVGNAVVSVRI